MLHLPGRAVRGGLWVVAYHLNTTEVISTNTQTIIPSLNTETNVFLHLEITIIIHKPNLISSLLLLPFSIIICLQRKEIVKTNTIIPLKYCSLIYLESEKTVGERAICRHCTAPVYLLPTNGSLVW